jgi:DNA-binding NarL/FixJ family response regulator
MWGQGVPPGEGYVNSLRVFLVDDHPIVRSGLKALVDAQADMLVVGESGDGLAAVQAVTDLAPDVVVMDVSLPGLGGAEATELMRRATPGLKVLALTAHEDRGYVQLLLKAGALGYVLKRAAADDLVRAIRAVAAGGVYLDPSVAGHVVSGIARRGESGRPVAGGELSERESEVLRLIAQGHAIKEIAGTLDVSARTVETYKERAMEKLELKSRAEIVRYALRRGWLKNA